MLTRWRTWRARRRLRATTTGFPAVRRLRLEPGDTLVASIEEPLTSEQAHSMKAAFEQALPGLRVLVTSGVTLTVVGDAGRAELERLIGYSQVELAAAEAIDTALSAPMPRFSSGGARY